MRINGAIRVKEVRLIDENNQQVGVINTKEALYKARNAGLDLVEVAPGSKPPVCRIMDYGKWLYQQKRKAKLSQKKQHTVTLKEIRLRPEIGDHDRDIKVNHARKFLEKGDKVQFTLRFRGREMMHADHGRELMNCILEQIEDIATVERKPLMQGRRMIMVVAPAKS